MKIFAHQPSRRLSTVIALVLSFAALSALAQFNGSDSFSGNNAKWDSATGAGTGNLTVNNSRFEYTATGTGTTRDDALRRWNVNQGTYTNDWSVQVDVHLAAFSGLTTHQSINLNLAIGDAAHPFSVPPTNAVAVAIDRYYDSVVVLDLYSSSSFGGITTEIPTTTTDAALRISFDSVAKTLTTWYDADGAANGYNWTWMETVPIPTNWNMTAASLFNAYLVGASGANHDAVASNIAVPSGQAYFDNFSASTSAPCPANDFLVHNSTWGLCAGAAYDGVNYLVGIQQNLTGASNAVSPIVAQLISSTGAQVGPLMATGRTGGAPMVAFDGTNYLMIWPDDARGDEVNVNDEVRGQFINRAGALVGGNFVVKSLSTGPVDVRPIGLQFDGSHYLALYGIGTNTHQGPYTGIAARLVSPAGAVGSEIPIVTSDLRGAALAFNGTSYFVAWMQHNGGNSNDVYGAFISKAGTVGTPFRISQNTSPSSNPLNVSSDGSNFFVVWPYDTGNGTEDPVLWELHGRIVTAAGGFGSSEFTVAHVAQDPFFPFIAFDGTYYAVTWTDRSDTNNYNIAGQFVTKTGTLAGSVFSIVACPGHQLLSPVVYGGGKDLVIWTDGVTSSSDYSGTAIKGVFISAAPVAPLNLNALGKAPTKVKLLWTDNSWNETGFEIQRMVGASGSWSHLTNVAADVTAYVDTAVTAGTTYYYQVRAFNTLGNSPFGNVSSATPLSSTTVPNAATGLTAVLKSAGKIKLLWTDNSNNEAGFQIQRKDPVTGNWVLVATVGSNITAYVDTWVMPCSKYKYWVYVYNPSGNAPSSNGAAAANPCLP